MSSRRPSGRSGPQGSGSRPRTRKDSASSAARRRAAESASAQAGKGSAPGTRKPGTRKPGTRKPGQPRSGQPAQSRKRSQATPSTPTKQQATRKPRRPTSERFNKKRTIRFSSGEKTRQFSLRALAILLFAVFGVVVVAGPLTQYLDQQQEKRDLLQQYEDTTARVKVLEQELARWQDDDYVRSQARERLGYVMPGETLYLVSDPEEGTPDELLAQRTQEVNDRRRRATPFYVTMWDSITVAGGVGELENPSNAPLIGPTTTPSEPVTSEAPAEDAPADQPADPTG